MRRIKIGGGPADVHAGWSERKKKQGNNLAAGK
jgi:hypothetical protein